MSMQQSAVAPTKSNRRAERTSSKQQSECAGRSKPLIDQSSSRTVVRSPGKQSDQRISASDHAVVLLSIADAKQRLGGIGTTKFYADARKYGLRIIAFGGRSMVRSDDLNALIERLTAEAETLENPHQTRARALTLKAVAARRAQRGHL